MLNKDMERQVPVLERGIDFLHVRFGCKENQRLTARDIQDLNQTFHTFLDKRIMLPGGMGKVVAKINHGVFIIGIGRWFRLRQHTIPINRETGIVEEIGILIFQFSISCGGQCSRS